MTGTLLTRTLTFRDLVFLIVGTVIGSGIFLVPGPVLRSVQSRFGLALLVWVSGGILSLLGALTYGELSAMRPDAGGLYIYIRECFGSLAAFLYGWTLFFLISSGSVATLAVGFGTYLDQMIPLGATGIKVAAAAMIVVVAAINVVGTRRSANVQNLATALKVAAIIFLTAALLLFGHHAPANATAIHPSGSLLSGFGVAMISVLWAYEGWQYCTFAAGETVDPQRNFPRAFLFGSLMLIAIYVVANLGYVSALGPAKAAASDSVAAVAARTVIGRTGSMLISIAVLISMFSAANGLTLTSPRVYYAMARDRLFFAKLAEVHPKYHTPASAVILGSIWAVVLASTGTFEQLLTYVVFAGWIFYALGALAVFVYRRNQPALPRPYRVPGYPWTPMLFVLAAAALVLNTLYAQPARAAIGLALVFSGVPAYLIWRYKNTA